MKALIQRVSKASVVVGRDLVGQIDSGLLLFLGVEKDDDPQTAEKLLRKVLSYRVFEDGSGRMNLSLSDVKGGLLVVSQFTLVADTRKGARPSFSSAAPPELGKQLYEQFVSLAKVAQTDQLVSSLATGRFGADMKVELLNDGPVTFLLEV